MMRTVSSNVRWMILLFLTAVRSDNETNRQTIDTLSRVIVAHNIDGVQSDENMKENNETMLDRTDTTNRQQNAIVDKYVNLSQAIAPRLLFEAAVYGKCVASSSGKFLWWPYDIYFAKFPCGRGPESISANWTHEVHIMTAAELMLHVSELGNNEHYRCTLVNFFSPTCPYSAKLAPLFNVIPIMYPNLYVIGVDARDFSRLYSKYGVVGTPTVFLWHNKMFVKRFNETYSMKLLTDFIERNTDAQRRKISEGKMLQTMFVDGPLSHVVLDQPKNYLLIAANIYLAVVGINIIAKSTIFRKTCEQLIRWYRETHALIDEHAEPTSGNKSNEEAAATPISSRTPSISSESSVLDLDGLCDPNELSDVEDACPFAKEVDENHSENSTDESDEHTRIS